MNTKKSKTELRLIRKEMKTPSIGNFYRCAYTGLWKFRSSGKCSRCEVNDAQSEHTCPYAEDINGDSDSLCDCCSDCEHECCMDI